MGRISEDISDLRFSNLKTLRFNYQENETDLYTSIRPDYLKNFSC